MSAMNVVLRLEWSGVTYGPPSMMGLNNGNRYKCCPMCRGIMPGQHAEGEFMVEAIGHRKNCELAEVIAKGEQE